jgi:hypothetical protein
MKFLLSQIREISIKNLSILLLFLIQSSTTVYAENYDNEFSLLCVTKVDKGARNEGQVFEFVYHFTTSPPSVVIGNYPARPAIIKEDQILVPSLNIFINRYTGTIETFGATGTCRKAPDKPLF